MASYKLTNLLLYLLANFFNQATTLSFNFSSFDPSNYDIDCKWNASISGGVIFLTTNQMSMMNFSFGQATYTRPLFLWDEVSGNLTDFSTSFSFNMNSLGTCYGDGIAFFLGATDIPFRPGIAGGGLGLAVQNQTSVYHFVAVEFDTYQNIWDPSYEHVGIDINSVASNQTIMWNSSTLINDGEEIFGHITYDSSTKNLSVAVTGFDTLRNKSVIQRLSYVVDLRSHLPGNVTIGFSASTGDCFEIHTINSWNFTSTLGATNDFKDNPTEVVGNSTNNNSTGEVGAPFNPKRKVSGLKIGLSISGCAIAVTLGFLCITYFRRKTGEKEDELALDFSMVHEFEKGTGPRRFLYNELACATNNFSEHEKLGEGGFGAVYKGYLQDTNSYVAVKKISKGSKQGVKEYASEICIISRLRHRNLVQLIGWCHEKKELLLVYEFMSNGSLDSHLFKGNSRFLTWELRYKIARGLASGLLYLHEEWEQCVIHRDIKSSNVMLDSNFNAKLGDFGLARFMDHDKSSQTTLLAGTMGYMAPECVVTGKANRESDVYSFGVVALEIACGRKPIELSVSEDQLNIVNWVWELYGRERLLEAVDPRLDGEFDEHQVVCLMVVGLWCAHPYQKLRPSIRQVIQVLDFEAPWPILPAEMPVPTYVAPLNSPTIQKASSRHASSSASLSFESFYHGR